MAWGTDFTTDIYLSRETYTSRQEVINKIEELTDSINGYKTKLKMYASANLNDILPDEWNEDPISWLDVQLNDLFELYDEDTIKQYRLGLYLDYLKENNIEHIKPNKSDE